MTFIEPHTPLDLWDVDEMERRFRRYLQACVDYDMKVGNMAAYFAIGIDKDAARDWQAQDPRGRHERTRFIKKVQKVCAMYREGLMEDGKINPVTGIFWQKNYDGLRDQTETIIMPANPLGDTTDAETLKRRYLEQKEQPLIAESENFSEISQKAAESDLPDLLPVKTSPDQTSKPDQENG